MHSVFEVAPVAHAIPITFVTKATWDAISSDLPADAAELAHDMPETGNGIVEGEVVTETRMASQPETETADASG